MRWKNPQAEAKSVVVGGWPGMDSPEDWCETGISHQQSRTSGRNYVREAVDALLAGKKVATAETKPYGCSVKY